jgi:hypothetical protein
MTEASCSADFCDTGGKTRWLRREKEGCREWVAESGRELGREREGMRSRGGGVTGAGELGGDVGDEAMKSGWFG